ncbi:hypothetical protein H8959_010506 [Pygathrix nigripes]
MARGSARRAQVPGSGIPGSRVGGRGAQGPRLGPEARVPARAGRRSALAPPAPAWSPRPGPAPQWLRLACPGPLTPAARSPQPGSTQFLNVFRHFRVDEWKRSTKQGDVAVVTDKTLKGAVYRIRGSVPAANYIQLPKNSTQSLGLTGRYLYVLFRPLPSKHFVIHLDVSTEVQSPRLGSAWEPQHPCVPSPQGPAAPSPQDNQVIRVSFSNLFKEFKSTATRLQFPFVLEARTPQRGDTEMGCGWSRTDDWRELVQAQSGGFGPPRSPLDLPAARPAEHSPGLPEPSLRPSQERQAVRQPASQEPLH